MTCRRRGKGRRGGGRTGGFVGGVIYTGRAVVGRAALRCTHTAAEMRRDRSAAGLQRSIQPVVLVQRCTSGACHARITKTLCRCPRLPSVEDSVQQQRDGVRYNTHQTKPSSTFLCLSIVASIHSASSCIIAHHPDRPFHVVQSHTYAIYL